MVIAGGSGFFGSYLIDYFKDKYSIKILTRTSNKSNNEVEYLVWDGKTIDAWKSSLENSDVLINLSGKSINCRFTEDNKEKLLCSRLDSTRALREAVKSLDEPPKVWLNASAGLVYKPGVIPNTEEDLSTNTGFLSEMAIAWEKAFFKNELPETRRVAMRISLLLGKEAGVFPVWKKLTKLLLGGKVGSGKQMISWMHIHDAARAVEFLIENKLEGPVNFSTNHPLSNAELMSMLRKVVGVPFGFPAPAFGIKIVAPLIGAEPSLLLDSVNFIPEKLNKTGFEFNFSKFEEACADLINE